MLVDKGKANWSWIEPLGERHEGILLMVDMMLEFGSVWNILYLNVCHLRFCLVELAAK